MKKNKTDSEILSNFGKPLIQPKIFSRILKIYPSLAMAFQAQLSNSKSIAAAEKVLCCHGQLRSYLGVRTWSVEAHELEDNSPGERVSDMEDSVVDDTDKHEAGAVQEVIYEVIEATSQPSSEKDWYELLHGRYHSCHICGKTYKRSQQLSTHKMLSDRGYIACKPPADDADDADAPEELTSVDEGGMEDKTDRNPEEAYRGS